MRHFWFHFRVMQKRTHALMRIFRSESPEPHADNWHFLDRERKQDRNGIPEVSKGKR